MLVDCRRDAAYKEGLDRVILKIWMVAARVLFFETSAAETQEDLIINNNATKSNTSKGPLYYCLLTKVGQIDRAISQQFDVFHWPLLLSSFFSASQSI